MQTQREEKILAFRREAIIEQAAQNWRDAMSGLKEAEALAEKAKAELLAACGEKPYEGKGVKVAQIERKGAIEYRLIPALKDVDLDPYRKPNTIYWTISLSLVQ